MTIASADSLHACRASLQVRKYEVHNQAVEDYCRRSRDLEKSLGAAKDDSYWRPVLRMLRSFRYLLCSNPVRLDCDLLRQSNAPVDPREMIRQCRSVFPQFAGLANEAIRSFEAVTKTRENPLLDKITAVARDLNQSKLAIVILKPALLGVVREALHDQEDSVDCEVVVPGALRGYACYDSLFLVGSAEWFPSHVFLAPRAPLVHVVRFDCNRDIWEPRPFFSFCAPPSDSVPHGRLQVIEEVPDKSEPSSDVVCLEPAEILPRVDFSTVIERVKQSRREGDPIVEAHLVFFAEDRAVLLDASEDSKVLVLDFGQESGLRIIRRIPVERIEPGMHVLLRSEGAGDYVAHIADIMLGERRASLRRLQTEWKARLRKEADAIGRQRICEKLRTNGSAIANEANLNNWLSHRNIRTEEKGDFAAIMTIIGWRGRTDEVWDSMGELDRAHRSAGFFIRKELLAQVAASTDRQMMTRARCDFSLPGVDAGALSAFLVEGIFERRIEAQESQLGEVFDREVGPLALSQK